VAARVELGGGANMYFGKYHPLGSQRGLFKADRAGVQRHRAHGHFIKEAFNTGTGNNILKFILTNQGAVSEMEREKTVERIRPK
jgi:hypothetical protein